MIFGLAHVTCHRACSAMLPITAHAVPPDFCPITTLRNAFSLSFLTPAERVALRGLKTGNFSAVLDPPLVVPLLNLLRFVFPSDGFSRRTQREDQYL